MTKIVYIIVVAVLISCGQRGNSGSKIVKTDSLPGQSNMGGNTHIVLVNKTIKFLWREDKYDTELKDTFYSISINDTFCKTITDPERAALGYVATFIGNECEWDGEAKDDRSNLKCKILDALNLGYQCSERHLGFLRKWFKNDTAVQEELKVDNCPTTPNGATIQNTFDEIILTVKGNDIVVSFAANGVNLREGNSWSWTESDHFLFDGDNIRLINKNKSKVKHEHSSKME
ncbi:MAG: hypothetical protein J0I41_11875 [Filimonas sp.]|nr:hypothetical protein [Filimonas sp.]